MIYFIQIGDEGPVKIGYAEMPGSRLTNLQSASPYELNLLLIGAGDRELERELHELFAASRIRGEWFEPSNDLYEFVGDPRNHSKLWGTWTARHAHRTVPLAQHD